LVANTRKLDVLIDLDELASNIYAIGLQNPIVVQEVTTNQEYKIISGQRRWLACKRIGLPKIPAIVVPKMTLLEAKIASLSENIYRKKMNDQDVSDAADYLYNYYSLYFRSTVLTIFLVHSKALRLL